MSFIDLSQNYSFYAIPIAWFLAFVPGAIAKSLGGKNYDAANPRKLVENVQRDEKLSKVVKDRIFRSEAAAANGYETLTLFATSVVAANYAGVPVETINQLVATYLGSRVVYNVTYIILQDNPSFAPLRSLAWTVSLSSWVALFVKAGGRL